MSGGSSQKGRRMKQVLFGILLVLSVCSATAEEKRYTVPIGDSPSTGPAGAPVIIVEFLDFQ